VTTKRAQNGNRSRKQLEADANETRERLMDRVSELDLRRDRIVKAVKVASKPPLSVALIAAAGVGVAALVAYRIHKSRRTPLERLVEVWLETAELPRPEGVVSRTLKNALMSVAVNGLKEIGRRGVDRVIAGDVERAPRFEPA
jgi:hypothetical protein